jgi:KDO2-lipid IV(A) lauroyltransferase
MHRQLICHQTCLFSKNHLNNRLLCASKRAFGFTFAVMLGYWISMAFANFISFLPFRALYVCADAVAFVMEHVVRYRKDVILQNLRNSFPEKSEDERRQIMKGFYRNFADIIMETFKSMRLTREEAIKRVTIRNRELFDQFYKEQRNVMVVLGHYANFEWVALTFPLTVKQACYAVFQPLKNNHFNRKVVQIRERFGLTLFPMKQTYYYMIQNPTPNSMYGFMADQSPQKERIKHWTKFLNQYTGVHLGVENLARKLDMSVLFLEVHRVRRGYYELEPILITHKPQEMAPFEITDRHVQALESLIRRKPEDWLWSHKRWKHQPDAETIAQIELRYSQSSKP